MLTVDDLNNVAAYILSQRGPMHPMELRQFLDRIAREAGILHQEAVIDSEFHPPMRQISRQLEEWDRINPGRSSGFDHLIFWGNPRSLDNQRRKTAWLIAHPPREEVVDHEFNTGNPDILNESQKREVDQIQ